MPKPGKTPVQLLGEPTERTKLAPLRQDRAVRTRALVVVAAAELFAERGFHGTSVKDVAERAEVTKGAVYFHFPDKETLASAVVEKHYDRRTEVLEDLLAERMSPLDTVVVLLDRMAVAFRDDPVIQGGARLQNERTFIQANLPAPFVGWTDLLTSLLRDAAKAGQLRPGEDPAALARSFVAAFFGVQHISDRLHGRTDIAERWAETRNLLLRAVCD